MWWNGSGWGMHGWWFMPIFGIVGMVIFLYLFARIFGALGCSRERPTDRQELEELRREVRELRAEIRALRNTTATKGEDERP